MNREQVALVREEWRVVDRWWTDEPVDRHYFEVVLEGGRNVCVYRDAGELVLVHPERLDVEDVVALEELAVGLDALRAKLAELRRYRDEAAGRVRG